MPQYICPRCGYNCIQRNDIRKHFNRKKTCYAILEDLDISECYLRTLGEEIEKPQKKVLNASDMHPKLRNMHPACIRYASSKNTEKMSNMPILPKIQTITCEFCSTTFTKHQNYYRHKKNRCKGRDDLTRKELESMIESRDQIIGKLSSQIEKLIDTVTKTSTTTNNTTNNTTHNTFNFVVNAFGKEDVSYIQDKFINDLIKSGPYNSIQKLIQEIHFHPDHSENQNIKIPNKKLKLAQIFNGVNWEYKDKKETIDNMTSKAYGILNEHYDKSKENKYMEQFRQDYESGNKDTVKRITDKTEITILNNQDK
jgi:hypothetical protein